MDSQDVAISVARNYTIARKNSTQLEDLQGWVKKQAAATQK